MLKVSHLTEHEQHIKCLYDKHLMIIPNTDFGRHLADMDPCVSNKRVPIIKSKGGHLQNIFVSLDT